eukprot:TRINITY_DN7870_c0_g1_i1.p2 TRINITY_DN7870_c0_g1~~TRINITY_DN7870_c0_g1_i1.p2  ORF type:complete len:326 (-),score=59.05 TRINITY_DN7870_c0_g1_i1:15-992(-)
MFDSLLFFLLRIRRPPRSTLSSSSAASDVYKRQVSTQSTGRFCRFAMPALISQSGERAVVVHAEEAEPSVYAIHLLLAGPGHELVESMARSANKYGKNLRYGKPTLTGEAPNPVWDANFCGRSSPHVELFQPFTASLQERALVEAAITATANDLRESAPAALTFSSVDGPKGGMVSAQLTPSAEAEIFRSQLHTELSKTVGDVRCADTLWLAPVAVHEPSKIPLGTLLGFVGELLESAAEKTTELQILALVRCDGAHGHEVCRTWDLCAEYVSAESNEDWILAGQTDISAFLEHAANRRADNCELHEKVLPSPSRQWVEERDVSE